MKNKLPRRYWLVLASWLPSWDKWKLTEWTTDRNLDWRQTNKQAYFEDLKTGDLIYSTFDLRNLATLHKGPWPKREKAVAVLRQEAGRLRLKQEREAAMKHAEPAKKLAKLQEDEKRWTRKLKLAQTKLKKIRAAIKRRSCTPLNKD